MNNYKGIPTYFIPQQFQEVLEDFQLAYVYLQCKWKTVINNLTVLNTNKK